MQGRHVTTTRLFLFTLQVYLESDQEDSPDFELWCEPSWHLRTASGVLTGSGAIDSPASYDDPTELERASATIVRVSEAASVLVGQALTSLAVDTTTHALTAEFSGGSVVATFSDDPNADALWVLRQPGNLDSIRGTPRGVAIGTRERVV
jgi:hypothetical protein